MGNPLNNDPRLPEIRRKKAKGGPHFGEQVAHKQGDPITPVDLLNVIFHNNSQALMKSFGKNGKKKREKALRDKKAGKTLKRTFSRNANGKVVMAEKIQNKVKKEK